MPNELDVIIVDDVPSVCQVTAKMVSHFYQWGEVLSFEDIDQAVSYCLGREIGVGIFIVDVFLGPESGFWFLDRIKPTFPVAHEDAIIITGQASDEIVNQCIAADITYLIEKPIEFYALQLAVRAIVQKYIAFAKRLLNDPSFAANISNL
jgi:response regulator of citrate/malate metabolism